MKLPIVIRKVLSKEEILILIQDFFKDHGKRFFGGPGTDLANSLINELFEIDDTDNSLELSDRLSIQKRNISVILLSISLLRYIPGDDAFAHLIKSLIEEDGDIVRAAYYFSKNIQNIDKHQRFNLTMQNFFPIISEPDRVHNYLSSFCLNGCYVFSNKCNISHSEIRFPIIYNDKICDWFQIYSHINFKKVLEEQKSNCSLLKFDQNYIKKITDITHGNNKSLYYKQIFIVLAREQFLILMFIILKNLLIADHENALKNADHGSIKEIIPYESIQPFCLSLMLIFKVIFRSSQDLISSFSTNDNQQNVFFRFVFTFNNLFALTCSFVFGFDHLMAQTALKNNEPNDSCLEIDYIYRNSNAIFNVKTHLLMCFIYNLTAALLTPKLPSEHNLDNIWNKPKFLSFSKNFFNSDERQQKRALLTICFNKKVKEGTAPIEFSTIAADRHNDLIENILDSLLGEQQKIIVTRKNLCVT